MDLPVAVEAGPARRLLLSRRRLLRAITDDRSSPTRRRITRSCGSRFPSGALQWTYGHPKIAGSRPGLPEPTRRRVPAPRRHVHRRRREELPHPAHQRDRTTSGPDRDHRQLRARPAAECRLSQRRHPTRRRQPPRLGDQRLLDQRVHARRARSSGPCTSRSPTRRTHNRSDPICISSPTTPGRAASSSSPARAASCGPTARRAANGMLDHPSLAELLPNGLIAVNDDYRHRVAFIDPDDRTRSCGSTGRPTGPGPGSISSTRPTASTCCSPTPRPPALAHWLTGLSRAQRRASISTKSRVPVTRYRSGGRTIDESRRSAADGSPCDRRERRERCPPGVDVELHRAHAAGPPQQLRERFDVEPRSGDVDEIAVRVDSDSGAPHVDLVADGSAPEPVVRVGEPGNQRAVVDDQVEVLTYCRDRTRHRVVATPHADVDAAVGSQRRATRGRRRAACTVRSSAK